VFSLDGDSTSPIVAAEAQQVEPTRTKTWSRGYDLYVIRPDGTGRASLDIAGLPGSGLFPDWIE
jgi:hypothetical protein